MHIHSNRGSRILLFVAALLVVVQWAQPANAFHVKGIDVTPISVDSVTRQVLITIAESTVGTGSVHAGANVQWGDAVSSFKTWTFSTGTGGGGKLYGAGFAAVSHVYPDLTDRTITVSGDCCNTSLAVPTDTAVIQLGCADTPKPFCDASAGKAQLQIKNNSDNTKDGLKFKWLNGTTTFPAPGEYYLCIYAPGIALQAIAAGANWDATGSGFKYKDLTGPNGGLTKVILKSSASGKAKIIAKGKGANLDDPLPLTQPVLVQLQHSSGSCWEHQFTSPEIKGDADQFKDKEP